jgi:DNA-binding transcriptional LysR family regulator
MSECQAMLLRREADILVGYETRGAFGGDAVERLHLGLDALIPVAAAGTAAARDGGMQPGGTLDVVGYPRDVFMGALLHGTLLPGLAGRQTVRVRCETALASGVMELVLSEIGIGWLPRSLARSHLDSGRLVALSHDLGIVALDITALKLRTNAAARVAGAWQTLGRMPGARASPP